MEYELEREELNILNLKEEATVLTTRLQESCLSSENTVNTNKSQISFGELLSNTNTSSIFAGSVLILAEVSHIPGNPPFHVTYKVPYGCVIDWATDDTRLKKGDK